MRATATGVPWIDEKIKEFRRQEGVDNYKITEYADGECVRASVDFADFIHPTMRNVFTITGTPDEFGYTDRRIPGAMMHTIVLVKTQTEAFGIDWTAAQYGYEEFPLVSKANITWEKLEKDAVAFSTGSSVS